MYGQDDYKVVSFLDIKWGVVVILGVRAHGNRKSWVVTSRVDS